MMAVAGARLKPSAHPGSKHGFPGIGDKRWLALKNVNKFVLPGMRMAQRRDPFGRKSRQLFIDRARIGPKIAAFREVDCLLLQEWNVGHIRFYAAGVRSRIPSSTFTRDGRFEI